MYKHKLGINLTPGIKGNRSALQTVELLVCFCFIYIYIYINIMSYFSPLHVYFVTVLFNPVEHRLLH